MFHIMMFHIFVIVVLSFSFLIAGNFGEVVNVELVMDRAVSLYLFCHHKFVCSCACVCKLLCLTFFGFQVNLPRGSGYVEFKTRADAEKAQLYMDGVCVI